MSKFTPVQRRSRTYGGYKNNRNTDDEKTYAEEYSEEKKKSNKEIKAVEKFVVKLCRDFVNNIVEAERTSKKYCYLFKYNDDPENGNVYNDTIDGIDTKYILSGKWIPIARQYFAPASCISIEQRLNEYISDKKFNNGVDPVTGNKYRISVFYYKGSKSVFSNGIIVSRDGLKYS